MPTVNIKTDYGAAGDGQIVTTTITMSSVTNPTHLAVSSSIFASGDVGKSIAVTGAGAAGANLLSTISSFTDAQHVVLADLCLTTVSGVSGAVEWGTNDTSAFSAFNTAQNGQANVTLIIPSGRYCLAGPGSGIGIGNGGITNLTVTGTGGPTLTDMLGVGSGWALNINGGLLFADNTAQSLVQTVNAGATVLHMITASDASKYSANTWAWMTGYDTQGFGAPPNPAFAEFVFITAVNVGAGTVTIQFALNNSYESRWPTWVAGSPGSGPPTYTGGSFGLGGPATLYLINQAWNVSQIWDGVNFSSNFSVYNCTARSITIKNSVHENFGPNVSTQQIFVGDNLTIPSLWELDKGTTTFMLSNSTVHGFDTQSRSPFNVILNNVTISTQLNGTSQNWSINNCSIPSSPILGPISFANSDTLSITNCTFTGSGYAAVTDGVETDITGAGAWSMRANGLMSRPIASGTGEPPGWATPGSYFAITSGSHFFINPVWKCVDIWEDATILYVQTDQSISGFPLGADGTTILGATAVVPALQNYTGNSGNDDAVGWTGPRLFSHWNKTYSGNIGAAAAAHLIKIWGQVVFIKITVFSGYSAGTLNLDGPFVVYRPQNTTNIWSPVVDLTVVGTRTILPSGTSGGGGADSNLTLPNGGNVWLLSTQITPAMSGAVGSGSVQIEMLTNQGFPADPPPSVLGLVASEY